MTLRVRIAQTLAVFCLGRALPADAQSGIARPPVIVLDSAATSAIGGDPARTPMMVGLVESMNATMPISFGQDRPVTLIHARCGAPGDDSYRPRQDRIVVCDETIAWIRQSWMRLNGDVVAADEIQKQAVWFIASHEFAHAIVARYDIATPGDEEAAVDELAAILILTGHPLAVSGGKFFLRAAASSESENVISTHHGSSRQRAQRLACLGTGRERADMLERLRSAQDSTVILRAMKVLSDLAERELGSQDRLVECWQYYPKALATWQRLLKERWKPVTLGPR